MKFGPRELRFTYPVWASFRGLVVFVGRRNTIHLQETAVVLEGELMRFHLPLIDRFVRRVFCEWSLVTVPYSRIVRSRYCTYLAAKVVTWLALALTGGFVACASLLLSGHPEYWITTALVLLLLSLLGLLVHLLLRPRHVLVFRGADGKRRLVCFRFTARQERNKFMSLLQANLDAVRALKAPAAAAPTRVKVAP